CQDHFEGDVAVERTIAGQVDDSHASAAQFTYHFVARDGEPAGRLRWRDGPPFRAGGGHGVRRGRRRALLRAVARVGRRGRQGEHGLLGRSGRRLAHGLGPPRKGMLRPTLPAPPGPRPRKCVPLAFPAPIAYPEGMSRPNLLFVTGKLAEP